MQCATLVDQYYLNLDWCPGVLEVRVVSRSGGLHNQQLANVVSSALGPSQYWSNGYPFTTCGSTEEQPILYAIKVQLEKVAEKHGQDAARISQKNLQEQLVTPLPTVTHTTPLLSDR